MVHLQWGFWLLVWLAAIDGPKTLVIRHELAQLKGTWSVVALTAAGQAAPADEDVHLTYVFDGQRIIVKGEDFREEAIFQIDPTQSPRTLDMLAAKAQDGGAAAHGIYELKGDELRLAFPLDKKRPRDLEPGPTSTTFTLRRIQPELLRAEVAKLQGTWSVVAAERDGMATTAAKLATARIAIENERFVLRHNDEVVAEGTWTLDVATKPYKLRITAKNADSQPTRYFAVSECDGKEWRIAIGLTPTVQPTSFDAKSRADVAVVKLRPAEGSSP